VVVVDIDPAHGGDASLADLVASNGPLPATLEVSSGGGGRHLYFEHPGGRVPNSAGQLGAGLDVRGEGGYVLIPPSRHGSGRRYLWAHRPLRPLPAWLTHLVTEAHETSPTSVRPAAVSVSPRHAWAAAALAGEVNRVRQAAEGCRNHTLNRAAFALGQIVAGGHLEADDVTATLTEAALAAGLTPKETRATIASGLWAGVVQPRHPATS
jgi:hypothetical protein